MASGFFDFLGFGSRRRSALLLLDRTLSNLGVNPAYMDDGMRFAIYKSARQLETAAGTPAVMDEAMREAAALISFCVLGGPETEEMLGTETRTTLDARFSTALSGEHDDSFDARLIKLVLAKGVAAPDISARVELMTDEA